MSAEHIDIADLPEADLLDHRSALPQDQQRRLRELREFLDAEIRPHTAEHWSRDEFAPELAAKCGEFGLGDLRSPDTDSVFRGFVAAELARADISISVYLALHSDLVMATLDELGSEEQKQQWLPPMRRMEFTGCFALTEPDHGSDVAGGLTTTARRDGDHWVLNGTKRWIGNGTIARIAIVWARDEADGQVKGFIVETDTPGFTATKIEHKIAVKIVQNADITLEDVRIPASNHLPGTSAFRDTNVILEQSRAGLAWQSVGAQMAIFDVARRYALERRQFGRPLAGFQLTQDHLVRIAANTTASVGIAHRMSQLRAQGTATMGQAAMAKLKTSQMARESAALGRQLMGGNGILVDREMGKIFSDVEAIFTYEGTAEVNTLIVGRALTGVSAFV
ncbi:acyl-CoA dehydrogenase family protein [Kocuria palustris]|uniref:acyl-CoA dehydrogenase family protein n=1 Tax=Kocuria palustris TaxID=71999 RepID=UPI000738E3ED|nr:acyl-CoA dehydrogenase family protein [Kocuria palustris]KUG54997.1 acyl-CoA dehydrogenase [Kocuria palustris]